ncbi:MAG: hypothetical protein J7M14_02525, partial [Planctomycetes bacterium]|nr:hypothetical protein [Planctomycetota bacterium]
MMRSIRIAAWFLIGSALVAGCSPIASQGEKKEKRKSAVDYAPIPGEVAGMLPRIREHVKVMASFGPRQTGQDGWEKTRDYIAAQLTNIAPQLQVERFSSTVTVAVDRRSEADLAVADEPFTHVVVEGLGGGERRWPAYSLRPNNVQACRTHPRGQCPRGEAAPCPNCERPRRLVDIGEGRREDFDGKDLSDAIVLLDFNSLQAWLKAASLGAAGAVFIEPTRTTVFQADKKYLETVPLHFPRVYISRDKGMELRNALAGGADVRITLKTRMRYKNVPGDCLKLTIPGKDRSYCFVLASHFDARCIVPDLSYGAAELWGPAELLELTRYFVENQPHCDIEIIFTSGHWQMQRPMRDYIASLSPEGKFYDIGNYRRIAMSVDLTPEGRS